MIRAVTFDFWDTIVADDTDEPRREAAGLAPKATARRYAFVGSVQRAHPGLEPAAIHAAYDDAEARFRHHWKVEQRTPAVADRLKVGLDVLGIDAPTDFDAVVDTFETMEVLHPPDLVPGIREALEALSGSYAIGIISDAIVTPGRGLREILDGYGLLQFFQSPVFSDEVGAAKPNAKVFEAACAGLEVAAAELVHVGDRESNDVAGPQAFGARAVLYTGAIDRGSKDSNADAICAHHDTLFGLIEGLS